MTSKHIRYADNLRQGTDKLNAAIDFAEEAKNTSEQSETNVNNAIDTVNQKVTEVDGLIDDVTNLSNEVATATSDLETVKSDAVTATGTAIASALNADEKAQLAQDKADELSGLNNDIEDAILNAETATNEAVLAAQNADTKAGLADNAATYANTQGQRAEDAADAIEGALEGGMVLSVNGQTGIVNLTAGDVGAVTPQELSLAIDDIPLPPPPDLVPYAKVVDLQTVDGKVDTVQNNLTMHWEERASSTKLGHVSNVYQYNVTSGGTGTVFGNGTTATGVLSFALGDGSSAQARESIATGTRTVASGHASITQGVITHAYPFASVAQGQANKQGQGEQFSYQATADAHIIGNGTSDAVRSNAFRVTFDGRTYGLSAFNSTGADYAEFFEWLDGNLNNEDRVGFFVTLDGDKIKIADEGDYIVGIVSATASVIGDSHSDQWSRKYITDVWGRPQTEEVEVENDDFDEEGNQIKVMRTEIHMQLNPHWNNEEEYIPREYRKEWDAVGMMGKLYVRDDGTCQVNGFCKVADGGIATESNEGYRVIKRIDANIVKVILK